MSRVIKSFFLGILTFFLVSTGIFVPLLYNFYVSGQGRLAELQRQVENRGVELALALGRLGTEQWGPRGMVSVSSAMNEVVQNTAGRTDEVNVREIFILDREGTIKAHNDFTLLAKESKFEYDQLFHEQILRLTDRNPVRHKKQAVYDPAPYYLPLFERMFGDLIQNQWTFGGAVFSLDGPIHWGTLHMSVEVFSVARVMADLVNDLIFNAIAALLISLVVTTVIVLLSLMMSKGQVPATAAAASPGPGDVAPPPYEGLEPYEDEEIDYQTQNYAPGYDEEEAEDPYADQELAGGRILDAIPLERTRRDRPPVGYHN